MKADLYHAMNILRAVLLGAVWCLLASTVCAQPPVERSSRTQDGSAPSSQELTQAPAKVDINPLAHDEEIGERLQSVLVATEWFTDPQVHVKEGVVFLNGRASSAELKKWAGDLARNTQDVVAVANRMEVTDPPVWDFSPASSGINELWRDIIRSLPFFAFGVFVLGISFGGGILTTRVARTFLRRRIRARLLLNVIARGAGVLVFLLGVYILLRVSGLTQLALSVVGGTGLVGLALGIAFRDITENFLASIFLSMQRPFETGDLVEIAGVTGYIQQLNIRTTILMTLDGNVVQIPNSTVYKSNLRNFTTNVNRREDFVVGIGYDCGISEAQEIAREVLSEHPAVLNDPEPLVLADSMGTATINLRVYFWLNGREHSWLKVRSSVIRLVKIAFQKNGISMPDEAREIVFPDGIPVTVVDRISDKAQAVAAKATSQAELSQAHDAVSTKAESGLSSEAGVIEDQASQVGTLKNGENLLQGNSLKPGGRAAERTP